MCDSHGGGGLIASLQAAMLAESDVGAPVNGGLISIVVVWQQTLPELALVMEDCLKNGKGERKRERVLGVYLKSPMSQSVV